MTSKTSTKKAPARKAAPSKKTGTKKTGPATIVVNGVPAIRDTIHQWAENVANANTALSLTLAKQIATDNAKVPAADFRSFKASTVKVLTKDTAILADVERAGLNVNTWRQTCNHIAQAAVAMIANPDREFSQLRTTSNKKADIEKAAATLGQTLINKDGKPDPRRANKAKGRKASGPALRKAGADVHPAAAQCVVIKAKRLGDAFIDHMRKAGEINAILAECSDQNMPEPAQMWALLQDVSKTTAKLAREFDRVRKAGGTRYEIQTGSNKDFAGLM